MVVDLLRHLRRDFRHRGQLCHRRLAYPARRAQRLQQAGANGRADAGNRVERGLDRALAAQLFVVRDREAVRLVAELLQRVQRRRGWIEQQRLAAVARVDLFLLLRQGYDRNPVEAEILEDLEPDVELAPAAVDEDQIWQHAPLLQGFAETAAKDLAQRREVVGPAHGADLEPLVVVFLQGSVLPDDHRADLLGALDVRDVIALDPIRRAR